MGQVGVGVDAAGHDPVTARVQNLAVRREARTDLRNAPIPNQDIGRFHAVGHHYRAAGDQQFAHGRFHVLATPGPTQVSGCASRGR